MKLLYGEGPDAMFGGGRWAGDTLVDVAKKDPGYPQWVFGRAKADGVLDYLEKM